MLTRRGLNPATETNVGAARVRLLDIVRGLCVALMLLDHFALFFYKFYYLHGNGFISLYPTLASYIGSGARQAIRGIVISVFFIVSGICCSYSRNNLRRGLLLTLFAGFITLITYIITATAYNCLIICGVIHCYAIFTLIYAIIERLPLKSNRRTLLCAILLAIFVVWAIVMGAVKPTLDGSNALIFLGVPATGYIPPLEYASPAFVGWAYFAGVIIGFRFKKISFGGSTAFPVLSYIGRHAAVIYLIHMPLIYAFIRLLAL